MPRLTKTQIEYFDQRTSQIMNALVSKEIKQLGPPPKAVAYSDAEKLQLIRAGKAKLNAENGINPYGYLTHHFTYPQTAQMKRANAKVKQYNEKSAEIREKYTKRKEAMMDEIILGDSDKATRVLQQLEQQLTAKK